MKKAILVAISGLVMAIFIASRAWSSEVQVRKFVNTLSDQVISIITSDAFSEEDKQAHLETIFLKNVDVAWISKFVLGRYWRESSREQRVDYSNLYEKYLLQSYIPKFRNYTNQEFEIKRLLEQSEDEYLVETQIINDNKKPIRVDYKVRRISDDSYRVFDVIAEGISLITTQRSEFGSILSRDGVDALISKLKIKVESSS